MNVLDLFSGACGGWSLGLHRAGFRTVAACEVIPWRRQRYAFNFPGVKIYDDVRTLTAGQLVADGIEPIHVLAGSPPCQDASAANSSKGGQGIDGERTGLFWEAVRLVQELRPDWVCLENVPPLRTRGYDRIHDALETLGYACRPLVVEAACAGAPHLRARVWIIANAPVLQWPAIARDQPDRDRTASVADAAEVPGRSRPDFPFAQSALGGWQNWNGGASHFERMDDGIPKGMARELLSAYGDAVIPQIPEIIGRAIMKAEKMQNLKAPTSKSDVPSEIAWLIELPQSARPSDQPPTFWGHEEGAEGWTCDIKDAIRFDTYAAADKRGSDCGILEYEVIEHAWVRPLSTRNSAVKISPLTSPQ